MTDCTRAGCAGKLTAPFRIAGRFICAACWAEYQKWHPTVDLPRQPGPGESAVAFHQRVDTRIRAEFLDRSRDH